MTHGPATDVARAVERTRLSWRRTTLTATSVAVIAAFRLALGRPYGARVVGVAMISAAWIAVFLICQHRIARLDRAARDPAAAESAGTAGRIPAVLALLVSATAVGALLAIR